MGLINIQDAVVICYHQDMSKIIIIPLKYDKEPLIAVQMTIDFFLSFFFFLNDLPLIETLFV